MNIKNIKDILKINRSIKNDVKGREIRRVLDVQTDGEKRRAIKIMKNAKGGQKGSITLVPMKSLSLEDFTFPFQNPAKIREALRLQVMPYNAAGELSLFPVILSKSGRSASGLVWYLSPEELDIPSSSAASKRGITWPAPLAFISKLEDFGGNGVTIWIDEENICSVLWQNHRPLLYRYKKLKKLPDNDAESSEKAEISEISWYDAYCKSRELERGGNFTVNVSDYDYDDNDDYYDDDADDDGDELSSIISESVSICPYLMNINLSKTALEGTRDLEKTVRILTRVSIWLTAAGIIMLSSGLLKYYNAGRETEKLRSRTDNFYRQTFDPSRTGRISNPVVLARDRIASLTGKDDGGHGIDEVLADLGEIFSEPGTKDVTLDILRYNADGIDCTGNAPDMTTVLNFRKSLENRASLVQVDNTQFVAGIGYRFDIRVRW